MARQASGRPALFACIEALHGEAPYGRVLDAGTGTRSMRWRLTVETGRRTAVSGAPGPLALPRSVGRRGPVRPRARCGHRHPLDALADDAEYGQLDRRHSCAG